MSESMQEILGLEQVQNKSKTSSIFHDHSVKHQTFDLDLYNDLKEMSPVLEKTLDEGFSKMKTFPDLSEDMFMNLFKYKPELRDIKEMSPSRKFNHTLLNELGKTEEFEKLRDMCKLNLLNSAIGTEVLHNKALEKINLIIEERKQKQKENKENGGGDVPPDVIKMINDLYNKEQKAKQNAQGQDQGQGNQPTGDGNNQGTNPGESRLSDKAAKALAEMQQQIAQTPEAQQVQQQIEQALQSAAKEAQEDVKEMDEFVNAWGLSGDDSPSRVTFEEMRGALERIRASNKLKDLTDIIGRFRAVAKNNLKKKSKGEGASIKDVCIGDDIEKMLPSEKGLLANKSTKKIFNKKYVEKQLLQYEVESNKRKGLGPMIVDLDVSGSMNDGKRNVWGRAVALALLEVAQRQKRNFTLSLFNNKIVKEWIIPKGELKPDMILDIAESHYSGGTTFSVPLLRSMEIIKQEKGFRKADIIFITDGDCDLSESEEANLLKLKKERNICIQTIIINVGGHCSDKGVERWSDSVKRISKLADLGEGSASDIFDLAIQG